MHDIISEKCFLSSHCVFRGKMMFFFHIYLQKPTGRTVIFNIGQARPIKLQMPSANIHAILIHLQTAIQIVMIWIPPNMPLSVTC